eukprot:TRINITY_DN2637_c0_g1_i3.p1 TRINITY_DN2637_c0_g1~~TRINITY_DN2637_c0_g1_i3.p1  ORF type:complete len:233 (-),score=53.55 TRINITY_DN2637_c0_g1_i3:128-826(-)
MYIKDRYQRRVRGLTLSATMACMESIQRRLMADGTMLHADGTPYKPEDYKGYHRQDPDHANVSYHKDDDVSQHPAWQRVLNPTVSQELIDAYLEYDTDEDDEIVNPKLNVLLDPSCPDTVIHQTDNVDFACRILREQRVREEGPDSIKNYKPNFEGLGSFWTARAERITGLRGPIAVRKYNEMKVNKYKMKGKKLPDLPEGRRDYLSSGLGHTEDSQQMDKLKDKMKTKAKE